MLTLIISTRNRSHYLKKLLSYYAASNLKYSIFIGDCSDAIEEERNKTILTVFRDKLNISYFNFPHNPKYEKSGVDFFYVLHALLEKVKTPYSVINADDDFLIPRCLEKCVEFLESNHEYSLAHGVSMLLTVEDPIYAPAIKGASEYRQCSNEWESASERILINFTVCASTEFSVKRTEQIREVLKYNVQSQFAFYNFGEVLNSALAAVQGKFKKLNQLYTVRLAHAQMSSVLSRDIFQWLTHPEFANDWKSFSDILSMALAQKEGVSVDEAQRIVKKTFWAYLGLELNLKWQGAYGQNCSWENRFKKWAQGKPLLKEIRNRVYSFLPGERFTLPALLRKSSPYYKDFMPIFQAIEG